MVRVKLTQRQTKTTQLKQTTFTVQAVKWIRRLHEENIQSSYEFHSNVISATIPYIIVYYITGYIL